LQTNFKYMYDITLHLVLDFYYLKCFHMMNRIIRLNIKWSHASCDI